MKRRDLLRPQHPCFQQHAFQRQGSRLSLCGQSAALPSSGGIHPVEAGQDRLGETAFAGIQHDFV